MIFQWLIPEALRDNVFFGIIVFGLGITFLTGVAYLVKDLAFEFLKDLLSTLLEIVGVAFENTFIIVGKLLCWPFDLIEFLFLRNTLLYKRRRYILELLRDTTSSQDIRMFLNDKLTPDTRFYELKRIENGLESLGARLDFISESFPKSYIHPQGEDLKPEQKTILSDTLASEVFSNAS